MRAILGEGGVQVSTRVDKIGVGCGELGEGGNGSF
jgi:hypothetical protein